MQEIVWHCIQVGSKQFLREDVKQFERDSEIICYAADDVCDVCLEDRGGLLIDLIQNAEAYGCAGHWWILSIMISSSKKVDFSLREDEDREDRMREIMGE